MAAFLYNQTLVANLASNPLYEKFYGESSNLIGLQVLGVLCI